MRAASAFPEVQSFDQLLQASLISEKWKKYRDTVHRLFTVNEPNEDKWKSRMGFCQKTIKIYCTTHQLGTIEAVTALASKQEDPRFAVQMLAAGYELVNEIDYTLDTPVVKE